MYRTPVLDVSRIKSPANTIIIFRGPFQCAKCLPKERARHTSLKVVGSIHHDVGGGISVWKLTHSARASVCVTVWCTPPCTPATAGPERCGPSGAPPGR